MSKPSAPMRPNYPTRASATAKGTREHVMLPSGFRALVVLDSPYLERDGKQFRVSAGEVVARMAKLLWSGADLPPLLSSFSAIALEAAAVEAPELPRALLVVEVPVNWQAQMQRLQCVSLHASRRHLNAALVKAVHDAGYGVLAYTVNDSVLALELLEWGVDALVTDQLDVIAPNFA